MNERGRVDVIHHARWGTSNGWYVFQCSIEQLSPFLSQAQSTAMQQGPNSHVLSSAISIRCIPSMRTRVVSLRRILHTLFHLHPRHYLLNTIPSIAPSTFLTAFLLCLLLDPARTLITTTATTEEVLCYDPSIYPSESNTPAPSVRPHIAFSKTPHPRSLRPCFPPFLTLGHLQTPAPKKPGGSLLPQQDPFTSQQSGDTHQVYRSRHLG